MNIDANVYGVDEEGPVPDVSDPNDSVVVIPPSRYVVLTPAQKAALTQIQPLQNDYNFGINLYLTAVGILSSI